MNTVSTSSPTTLLLRWMPALVALLGRIPGMRRFTVSLCDSRTRITLLTLLNRFKHLPDVVFYRNHLDGLGLQPFAQRSLAVKMLIFIGVAKEEIA